MLWIVLLAVVILFADVIFAYLLEHVVAPLFVLSAEVDPTQEKQSLRRRLMPTNVRTALLLMVVIMAGVVYFMDRKKISSPLETARERFLDDVARRAAVALEEHVPKSKDVEKSISDRMRQTTDSIKHD